MSMVVIYTVTTHGQQYTLTETLRLDEFPPCKKDLRVTSFGAPPCPW